MKGTVSPNSLKVRSFQGWLKDLIQRPEIFPALIPPILIGLALWLHEVSKTSSAVPQKGFHHRYVSILGKRNFHNSSLILVRFYSDNVGKC